jgi:hypothetical protein
MESTLLWIVSIRISTTLVVLGPQRITSLSRKALSIEISLLVVESLFIPFLEAVLLGIVK